MIANKRDDDETCRYGATVTALNGVSTRPSYLGSGLPLLFGSGTVEPCSTVRNGAGRRPLLCKGQKGGPGAAERGVGRSEDRQARVREKEARPSLVHGSELSALPPVTGRARIVRDVKKKQQALAARGQERLVARLAGDRPGRVGAIVELPRELRRLAGPQRPREASYPPFGRCPQNRIKRTTKRPPLVRDKR